MLLTLVSSSNAENAETLWGFIGRYKPGVTAKTHPELSAQVEYAIHYFRDFVQPEKKFRHPTDSERAALIDLRDALAQLEGSASAEDIQNVVYEVGRREPFLDQSRAYRSTGSTCSTRCCSARTKARASAPSSRSTACRTPST
jgi:lysyl-tRNA synthetase class 1